MDLPSPDCDVDQASAIAFAYTAVQSIEQIERMLYTGVLDREKAQEVLAETIATAWRLSIVNGARANATAKAQIQAQKEAATGTSNDG